ncbi:hypothetical protein K2P47_02335 [Patescibacteria group bacterium]|nr:hypothetical protein [Patescibacteria group bacterium]
MSLCIDAGVAKLAQLTQKKSVKIIGVGLFLLVVLATLMFGTQFSTAGHQFSSGSGTAADPYVIADCTELQSIDDEPENLYAHYILAGDIDCSGIPSFETIGNYNDFTDTYAPFRGWLDGQGYTISNVSVGTAGTEHNGIFASIQGASIRNLRLDTITVNGSSYLGALAGEADHSALIGISVTNSTITSQNSGSIYVGGLVGLALTSSFYGISVATTTVTTAFSSPTTNVHVGGIAGNINGFSTIERSMSQATVTANVSAVGGLVGSISYASTITNSYSTAVVSGYNRVGGITGAFDTRGIDSYIDSTYSDASTTATFINANVGGINGGLIGVSTADLHISNSFVVGRVSSTTLSGGISGVSSSNLSNTVYYPAGTNQTRCTGGGASYTALECTTNNSSAYYNSSVNEPLAQWDFTNVWSEVSGARPSLNVFPYTEPIGATSITTCADLSQAVKANPVGWFLLGNNVDCTVGVDNIPLNGNVVNNPPFHGILDGQGFTISGIAATRTSATQYQAGLGLFSRLYGATIRNVNLDGGGVTALSVDVDRVGGLAGTGMAVMVNNATSSVPARTGGQFGGGLIGYGSGEFTNISVSADVDSVLASSECMGGIVGCGGGFINMETVSYTGSVTGYNFVGGILGVGSFFLINNATSSGTLTAGGISGGIVGDSNGSFELTSVIDRSFSNMDISPNYAVDASLGVVGGVVGSAGGVSIINSRFAGSINIGLGYSTSIGGIAGYIGTNVEGTPSMIASSSVNAVITSVGDGTNPFIENIGGLVGDADAVVISTSTASTTMRFGSDTVTNYISSFYNIGGLVGNGGGLMQINNVETRGSITVYEDTTGSTGYGYGLGGFFGASYNPSRISNATSSIDLLLYSYQPGGVGNFAGEIINATTTNIVTTGAITIDAADYPYNVGGFVGYANNLIVGTTTVLSDLMLTDTAGSYSVAGFAGYLNNSSVYTTFTDSMITINSGNAFSTGAYYIGGFLGRSVGSNLTDTYASTSITVTSVALNALAASDIGGYVGGLLGGTNTITNAYSSGALTLIASSTAPYQNVGGFIGASESNLNSISNTFTVSAISSLASSTRVGGYIGTYVGGETFADNRYDVTRTTRTLCSGIDGVDPLWCSAQNIANSTPTYFYTATNPPQSTWNFLDIWLEHPDTYPTFGVGVPVGSSTPATVSTQAGVATTTETSAEVVGEITDVGSGTVTERGFVYGTTTSLGATTTQTSLGYSTGAFTETVSGLTCATAYFFAAYASGTEGVAYGSTETFVTSACAVPPLATSTPPTNNSSGGSATRNSGDREIVIRICQVTRTTSTGEFIYASQDITTVDAEGVLFDDTETKYRNAIIPAFSYRVDGELKTYSGKNLSSENNVIYSNNCIRPTVPAVVAVSPLPQSNVPVMAPLVPPKEIVPCDPKNLQTVITSALGNETTVSIMVPANSISSTQLNAAGRAEFEVLLTTAAVDANVAAAKSANFTNLLLSLMNTEGNTSSIVVNDIDTPYNPPLPAGVRRNENAVNGVVEFVSSGPCTPSRATVQNPPARPIVPPVAVTVTSRIIGEQILTILDEIDVTEATLLTEPFVITAADEQGNSIEVFDKPFPVTISNPNVRTDDAYIYIVKLDRDNATWFEVPYVSDGNNIRITIEQPGEYFVWLLPKKANAFSGTIEPVSNQPWLDFTLPGWLMWLLTLLGLTAGVVMFLGFISKIPFSVTNGRPIVTQASRNVFGLLVFRKKIQPWGTIYDSETKAPLDPAYVELFDEAGVKRNEAITDLDGRYGFLVPPGVYTMNVRKSNYVFPSIKLQSATRDIIYTNLYHGGPVTVSEAVACDIPMDAVVFDWNQYEKLRTKQTIFFSRLDVVVVQVLDILFFVGAVAMVLQFMNAMNIVTGILAIIYLFLFVMRIYSGKPALYGVVTEGGKPLSHAVIKIYQQGREVASRITDDKGRYIALVNPGRYEVRIEKRVSQDRFETVLEQAVKSKNGMLNVWLKVPVGN